MKKFVLVSLILAFSGLTNLVKADEGMWLPMFIKRLNHVDMQKHGLQLSAEEIYSINNASLKDAIVHFNGGCTAEVISKEGLLLTNHHCGYDAIANHSTAENDYLTNGFWAYERTAELPNEGMTVSFLHRMEDVTNKVNETLNPKMSEDERKQAIKNITDRISKEASESGKYRATVSSFYQGNEFYLFVYKIYTDIRLVGAPPSSIGKFGGDTDNWMWPRHTGDFSIFRIYSDQNNEPAVYSKENKPYSPKHHLPISLKGVNDGDFAMIMGYPGRTDRYLTSWGINQKINIEYPAFVESRDLRLKIMKKYMDADSKVRISYASNYAQVANYWKNRIGMIEALTNNKTAEKKREVENQLSSWIAADKMRKAEYGDMFSDIKNYFEYSDKTVAGSQYLMEAGLTGSSYGLFTFRMSQFLSALAKASDPDQIVAIKNAATNYVDEFFSGISVEMEKELLVKTLELYYKKTPIEQQPEEFTKTVADFGGSVENMCDHILANSIMVDKAKLIEAINSNSTLGQKIENDVAIKVYGSMVSKFFMSQKSSGEDKVYQDKFDKAKRLFVKALREANPSKVYYPDANSTMRLTYGNVLSYQPKDGIEYQFITTLQGVIEKEDPTNEEFIVDPKLKELYLKKDYGQYANADGTMPVAFLSNTDITGGNSGSPVINGKGELIGCAFDGNWEAMSGDIEFEPKLQRTISVDIRYVLFIIDKFAGAKNLINEMTLVK